MSLLYYEAFRLRGFTEDTEAELEYTRSSFCSSMEDGSVPCGLYTRHFTLWSNMNNTYYHIEELYYCLHISNHFRQEPNALLGHTHDCMNVFVKSSPSLSYSVNQNIYHYYMWIFICLSFCEIMVSQIDAQDKVRYTSVFSILFERTTQSEP